MSNTALLLNDAIAPITSEIGFIEVQPENVASWFRDWEQSTQAPRRVRVRMRTEQGSLRDLLRSLEPLTSVERRRAMFVPTRSSWTAYFDNGWQGADAAVLAHVAKALQCRALRVVCVPNSMGRDATKNAKGRWATILEMYGPNDTDFLNYVRTISVVNDGDRWVFAQSGQPFPFEEVASYKARLIRDRFRADQLNRYLVALGIKAFDDTFYAPSAEALLIEREGPSAPDMREYSLEEVRAKWCT